MELKQVKLNGTIYDLPHDKTYEHTQLIASNTWVIVHNLQKYPSVTVVDSGDNTVVGDVVYIDTNTLQVSFTAAFSGKAYLN